MWFITQHRTSGGIHTYINYSNLLDRKEGKYPHCSILLHYGIKSSDNKHPIKDIQLCLLGDGSIVLIARPQMGYYTFLRHHLSQVGFQPMQLRKQPPSPDQPSLEDIYNHDWPDFGILLPPTSFKQLPIIQEKLGLLNNAESESNQLIKKLIEFVPLLLQRSLSLSSIVAYYNGFPDIQPRKVIDQRWLSLYHNHYPKLTSSREYYTVNTHSYHSTSYTPYTPSIHHHFPTDIPPIHRVAFEGNFPALKSMVEQEPDLVFQLDPWGYDPLGIAITIQHFEMRKYLGDKISELGGPRLNKDNFFELRKNLAKEQSRYASRKTLFSEERQQRHLKQRNIPLPKRHPIFDAAIAGDKKKVLSLLDQTPSLLNSHDPWGLNLVFIAASLGYEAMLSDILKRGANPNTYDNGLGNQYGICRTYRPLLAAKNEKILRLLLYHGAEVTKANDFYCFMVRNKPYYVEWLARYTGQEVFLLEDNHGFTPLDRALALAQQDNGIFFKILLSYCTKQWPNPQLSTFPEKVRTLLHTYNSSREKYLAPRLNRSRIKRVEAYPRLLVTQLAKEKQSTFLSKIMAVSDLFHTEPHRIVPRIRKLYDSIFDIHNGKTEPARDYHFYSVFDKNNSHRFVELFFDHQGNLASFFVFDLLNSTHPSVGFFYLVYGVYAGVNPQYKNEGLCNLFLRIPLAMTMICSPYPVYYFAKLNPPGYSYRLVPRELHAYPKRYYNLDLVKHIATITHNKFIIRDGRLLLTALSYSSKTDRLKRGKAYQSTSGSDREFMAFTQSSKATSSESSTLTAIALLWHVTNKANFVHYSKRIGTSLYQLKLTAMALIASGFAPHSIAKQQPCLEAPSPSL